MQRRIFIVGMNLNGKVCFRIDQFNEKRETIAVPILANHIFILREIIGKKHTVKATADNRIHTIRAACQFPGFRNFFTGNTLTVFTGKTFASPNDFFCDCTEFQKFHIKNPF